jgi:hypothetical protein
MPHKFGSFQGSEKCPPAGADMPFNVCGSMDLNTELPSAWVILAYGQTGKIADFKVQSLRQQAETPAGLAESADPL